jgi:large subunit ribosomal protein L24
MKKIHKDDRVIVISGDDRGKEGVVLKVDSAKGKAIVEGINFVKRHQRPTRTTPRGGILEKESPVDMSDLMVICGKCNAGVKTRTVTLSDGNKVRACKKCGEMLAYGKE